MSFIDQDHSDARTHARKHTHARTHSQTLARSDERRRRTTSTSTNVYRSAAAPLRLPRLFRNRARSHQHVSLVQRGLLRTLVTRASSRGNHQAPGRTRTKSIFQPRSTINIQIRDDYARIDRSIGQCIFVPVIPSDSLVHCCRKACGRTDTVRFASCVVDYCRSAPVSSAVRTPTKPPQSVERYSRIHTHTHTHYTKAYIIIAYETHALRCIENNKTHTHCKHLCQPCAAPSN